MNVLLISECDKKALVESRRILDQFAERRGERTWQTAITQAGLDTLRKLLRKTARKNTAVACHWIRGKDHSELLWIVGDIGRFNAQGAVPTGTTAADILRAGDENDWHTGEDIKLLAMLAALLHDLGKASVAFQQRLHTTVREKNLYRHEWVSLRLFLAFVGNDDDETWLRRMAAPTAEDDARWLSATTFFRDGIDAVVPPPFKRLSPLAAAIAWLVVTHHRLPVVPEYEEKGQAWLGKRSTKFNSAMLPNLLECVGHDWNEIKQQADAKDIEAYWQFDAPLPVFLPKWRQRAAKLAQRLLALRSVAGKGAWLENPYVMHIARLCLMLADHHYSSLSPESEARVKGDGTTPLYANTHKDGSLKQPLDEHLLGVARFAGGITHSLPSFERLLPSLARHRGLKKRSAGERFRWQDKAADAATALREKAAEHGGFIVNMASTGCGKTLANARILYALADPRQGLRATFALGLRTLTLQTGRSYREDLHLGEDELAVRVGGASVRELFEYYEAQAESSGSASIQELIDEDTYVVYEGQYGDHPLLSTAMANPHIRSMLSAPLLVCTVDHLTPATEAQRAGRQIAPMLRLMTSDLVLDELDDFDIGDLPALTRLVHWAGLLGSRVLLSSATLPPALVIGMYDAYRAGRAHYLRNRGHHGGQDAPAPAIPCLWADEFGARSEMCADADRFTAVHTEFVQQRTQALQRAIERDGARRCGELLALDIRARDEDSMRREFAASVQRIILTAHERHHETCPHSGKRVSFGLVRMANIEPLFDVARELFRLGAPEDVRIHLCVYHARFPLLQRSAIEHQLDNTLDRRQRFAVYDRADIREAIDNAPEHDHLFVVLGSPVTEVGRDHDYDWAVVEPSSMRSLIQLAGRVQRHRQNSCMSPNIFIFDTNLRHFEKSAAKGSPLAPAFVKPGFEDANEKLGSPFRLVSHRLEDLLREDEYRIITARPRIASRPPADMQPTRSLVDLEHARMREAMLPKPRDMAVVSARRAPRALPLDAACAWQFPQAALTWVLPQQQPFRRRTYPEIELRFLPDEDETCLIAHRVQERTKGGEDLLLTADSLIERIDLECGPRIAPWGEHDLFALLVDQAEARDMPLAECANKFTTVGVPDNDQGWRYHPVLGFGRKK